MKSAVSDYPDYSDKYQVPLASPPDSKEGSPQWAKEARGGSPPWAARESSPPWAAKESSPPWAGKESSPRSWMEGGPQPTMATMTSMPSMASMASMASMTHPTMTENFQHSMLAMLSQDP